MIVFIVSIIVTFVVGAILGQKHCAECNYRHERAVLMLKQAKQKARDERIKRLIKQAINENARDIASGSGSDEAK